MVTIRKNALIAMVSQDTGCTVQQAKSILDSLLATIAVSLSNPQKAKQILGWEAKRTVLQAIKDAWNFLVNNEKI